MWNHCSLPFWALGRDGDEFTYETTLPLQAVELSRYLEHSGAAAGLTAECSAAVSTDFVTVVSRLIDASPTLFAVTRDASTFV